jgi:leader peptidase (prepilin peptidase)/N-methyltransferase
LFTETPTLVVLVLGAATLGAILGSFLNALLFRFKTGKGMGGRSRCMRCNHVLYSKDLVPVLSYTLLGGKCRYCGTHISIQYPLVEGIAALLSVGVLFVAYPNPLLYAFWLVTWMIVLFIFVYDLRHMIIPWNASLSLLVFAVASLFLRGDFEIRFLVAGFALAAPLFFLSLVSRGMWMGWADSLLELSLGMVLGPTAGVTALLLGIWSGALVGVGLILLAKLMPTTRSRGGGAGFTIHSEIPFAPFLTFGAALAFFFHVDFFSTFSLF